MEAAMIDPMPMTNGYKVKRSMFPMSDRDVWRLKG
jgi:hypothetical protein